MLGSTVDTKFASVYGAFLHFSAMLGSTVDTNLRTSTELFCITRQRLVRQWIQFAVSSRSSFVFQCNAWFDSGYMLPRSSSFSQWHGYCWYAGCDAFVLCSLRRRQARAVSTGAVAACFASWVEGLTFWGPAHRVQGRGSCPQGHGPPQLGASVGVPGQTRSSYTLVRTTTTTTTTSGVLAHKRCFPTFLLRPQRATSMADVARDAHVVRAFWRHEQQAVACGGGCRYPSHLRQVQRARPARRLTSCTSRPHLWLSASAPAPAVTYVPSHQLPPVHTTTTVTTDDNLDLISLVYPPFSSTAVEPFAPRVVGSLPPVEELSAPVYHQVHRELFAENIAEIPVVQEQVIVGTRPERLVDARGPQRCDRTVRSTSVRAPVLAVQSLRGFDGVDDTAAKFLLQQALKKEKEEEEERRLAVALEKEKLKVALKEEGGGS